MLTTCRCPRAVLLLLVAATSSGCALLNHGPSAEEKRIRQLKAAEEFEVARKRNEELVALARRVEILEPEQMKELRYKVVGYAAHNVDPRNSGSGVLALQMQAAAMGGNALAEVAHELITLGMQGGSTGNSSVMPLMGGAYGSSNSSAAANVQYAERWTAKVLVLVKE